MVCRAVLCATDVPRVLLATKLTRMPSARGMQVGDPFSKLPALNVGVHSRCETNAQLSSFSAQPVR
jgi:hypothetical protein